MDRWYHNEDREQHAARAGLPVKGNTPVIYKEKRLILNGVFRELMIYLTAIGYPPSGSCSVHIYTQTIQGTPQNKKYIEQHKNT